MAKTKTKQSRSEAAMSFFETGEYTPDTEEQVEDNLDEQLDELAEEQQEETEEEPANEEPALDEEPPAGEEEEENSEVEPPNFAKSKQEAAKAKTGGKTDEEIDTEKNGNVADEDPDALPEEMASHPRVQALLKTEQMAQHFMDSLAEGYAIDTTDPVKALEALRAERADAHMLYQIMDGHLDASSLLGVMEKNFEQPTQERVFLQLATHLERNGFLRAYLTYRGLQAVPAGGDPNAKDENGNPITPQVPDPVQQKLMALENQINQMGTAEQRRQAAIAQQTRQVENDKHEQSFRTEVERLCSTKQIDKEFLPDYVNAIISMINSYPGGKAAVLNRIRSGDFRDVRRFFNEHHNAQIQRLQKWTKQVIATKSTTKTQPTSTTTKRPAGSPSAASTPNKKRPVLPSKADRLSKAMKALDQ